MKLTLTLLTVLAALLLSFSFVAQEQPSRVVYINTQAVIAEHPAGQEAVQIEQEAREELAPILEDIEAMQARVRAGETLTVDERGQYDLLVQTYQAASESYAQEIERAAQPAIDDIDRVIREIAQENGYAMVLDGSVAQRSRLVVYADPSLDITEQVIERVR